MASKRVGVFGAGGRMGTAVCAAVASAPDLDLVAAIDPAWAGVKLSERGVVDTGLVISPNAAELVKVKAEVVVDFTVAEAARDNLFWCAENEIHAVVGTTGFSAADLEDIRVRFEASKANALIAPNFAIGAVLMMRFAELAAPYFETAEIIELHHDQKVDAPSGTAILTAERMAAASSDFAADPTEQVVIAGARGASGPGGIPIHSVRMRGMVAHEEVILGSTGQTLTVRHDSYDRTSFMPGVLLAIRSVFDRPGLTVGLDPLLDI